MSASPAAFVYKIKEVCRVIDGDTVDLLIDLGFEASIKKRVRLSGIDTPEIRTRNKEEKKKGYAAKARLEELIRGDVSLLTLRSDGLGKYGRVLGTIYNCDRNINNTLVEEGYAISYE